VLLGMRLKGLLWFTLQLLKLESLSGRALPSWCNHNAYSLHFRG
jgi:hypothetical protein